MSCSRLFILVALWLSATLAEAAGFATIEIPASQDGPALRGAVWTPCASPAGEIRRGLYLMQVVRDCALRGDHLPLIVLSHGYGGSFLGHHDTAEALADAGFVVAAINHSEDNYQIRGGPNDSISALATRTTDISRLLDYMTRDWPLHARLDDRQIGFFGFSRGGYTGLVLAGARPDFERLPPLPSSPCTAAPEGPACAQMRQRFRKLLASPLSHDRRIRAAVIADPFNAVFGSGSLKDVSIPIQLWASAYGGDGVTPEGVAAIRRELPMAPEWHSAEHAAHFAFLAPCSPAQLEANAEICKDGAGFDRTAFHAGFNAKVVAFFRLHLVQLPAPAAGAK